jgi:hypothetical protein
MTEEIHDTSRLDAFMAARRRAMLLNAVWRPMAAGAAGAALIISAVYVALPKFSVREIVVPAITMKDTEVPKVTMRDVSVPEITLHPVEIPTPEIRLRPVEIPTPNVTLRPVEIDVPRIVPRDVQVDHFVPHDVQVDIPRIEAAPTTPEERAFTARPEFQSAQFKGRLTADPDGLIRFDDGSVFVPAVRDRASKKPVRDFSSGYLTRKYWGDLAFCNALSTGEGLFECLVIHDGVVIDLETTRRAKHPA